MLHWINFCILQQPEALIENSGGKMQKILTIRCLTTVGTRTARPLQLGLRNHCGRGEQKDSESQRIRMSTVRWCLLDMTGNLHLWNIAIWLFKQDLHHDNTNWYTSTDRKFYKTPFLSEELQANRWLRKENQPYPGMKALKGYQY